METRIYLWINSLLYLVFGVWCTVAPEWTSQAVGLSFIGAQGFTEYIAVYGGLEFGVGLFFGACLFRRELINAGIVFGTCFYIGLALFRTIAVMQVGLDIGNAVNFYIAEIVLAVWSVRLFFSQRVLPNVN